MSLEVYGRVSISCEAKREWHQPRADGKRRRRWIAMFVKVPWVDMAIYPDLDDNRIVDADSDWGGSSSWGPVWASLLMGSSRTYRDATELLFTPIERQELRSEIGYSGEIPDETLSVGISAVNDDLESWIPEDEPYIPASRLPFWGHNSDLPDVGYHGARAHINEKKIGEFFYRMECPCGYRIPEISGGELRPVLDQLSAGGMRSISIQRLLPILDRA